ncbi:MAG: hypothetical protein ABSG97_04055 [Sedimentisphaerales bacterium]|jgi:hypothetical protein
MFSYQGTPKQSIIPKIAEANVAMLPPSHKLASLGWLQAETMFYG